jgi:hypothetical protein
MPHYVSLIHPFPAGDMRQNSQVVTAWSYSDINRLYNFEVGEFSGIRFCESNMVPFWTGFANNAGGMTYTPGTAGNLATNTYFVKVTGTDGQNQFESQVYAVSAGQSVTGPNGSIAVLTPNTTGFTYTVYLSLASGMTNAQLGLTTSGPTSGPMAGQATQLPPATSVVITGLGLAQQPPASPGTGLTVYPTYIIGRGAYGQVTLDDVKFTYLKEADKSDPLNQLRVVGWKTFYGTLIENNQFFMRIESLSAFSATFG